MESSLRVVPLGGTEWKKASRIRKSSVVFDRFRYTDAEASETIVEEIVEKRTGVERR